MEVETWIPVVKHSISQLVLMGDPNQLGPTVRCRDVQDLQVSLMERVHACLLWEQYRMPKGLCELVSNLSYEGKLGMPRDQEWKPRFRQLQELPSVVFFDFSGSESQDVMSRSRSNNWESEFVSKICLHFQKKLGVGLALSSLMGVITPYVAQRRDLSRKIREATGDRHMMVETVDAFQGQEKDIIVISTVRSNERGSIGFVGSRERINVAISRARTCVMIVGNSHTLKRRSSTWETIVQHAIDHRSFVSVPRDEREWGNVIARNLPMTKNTRERSRDHGDGDDRNWRGMKRRKT
jgi:superfamily I DNA and/or RNA helicase